MVSNRAMPARRYDSLESLFSRKSARTRADDARARLVVTGASFWCSRLGGLSLVELESWVAESRLNRDHELRDDDKGS